jgi:hypothetical protein
MTAVRRRDHLQGVPRGGKAPIPGDDKPERIARLKTGYACSSDQPSTEKSRAQSQLQLHRAAAVPGAPHQHRADVIEALDPREITVRIWTRFRSADWSARTRIRRADIPGPGKTNDARRTGDLHIRIEHRLGRLAAFACAAGAGLPDFAEDD